MLILLTSLSLYLRLVIEEELTWPYSVEGNVNQCAGRAVEALRWVPDRDGLRFWIDFGGKGVAKSGRTRGVCRPVGWRVS